MARVLKLGISVLLWIVDGLRALVAALLGRALPARAVVLYYHAVDAQERGRFAAQMDALKRSSVPLPAAVEVDLEPRRRYAAVTFDDGFASVLDHVLPELACRRIPMTFFVPTGCWGQRPSWVTDPRARQYAETVLTREQACRAASSQWITIGAHSVSHPDLLSVDESRARYELETSKKDLESLLGREVALFSFPHGGCNARLIQLARVAGYRRVFTISPVWAFQTRREFVTGRVAVEPSDWPIEFWLKLRGAYRWCAAANQWEQKLNAKCGGVEQVTTAPNSCQCRNARG